MGRPVAGTREGPGQACLSPLAACLSLLARCRKIPWDMVDGLRLCLELGANMLFCLARKALLGVMVLLLLGWQLFGKGQRWAQMQWQDGSDALRRQLIKARRLLRTYCWHLQGLLMGLTWGPANALICLVSWLLQAALELMGRVASEEEEGEEEDVEMELLKSWKELRPHVVREKEEGN